MDSLASKRFNNKFTGYFPGDLLGVLTPRQTPGVLYSLAEPTPVKAPELIAWSDSLARELKIAYPEKEDIEILAGNRITPSMVPFAQCYGGHQFGRWAGQLGDGRAIGLGEWITDSESWEFQLKGAGPTPYSRGADGRAVLRSSVREYLASEAMHHLGVPTTRALSLVSTGETVLRDMFYDGNPEYERGAVILRAAPSFLRFGSFEILMARGEADLLSQLTSWTIDNYFTEHKGPDQILHWFKEVMDRTISLLVEWERVGFVHGVMNTDNMSVLGLTMDYGPFSFLDNYDPNFTPNTTDLPGRRYAFGKQYEIAHWNLIRMATALLPIIEDPEPFEDILNVFVSQLTAQRDQMMNRKLGLDTAQGHKGDLLQNLEAMLVKVQPDYTLFFRCLTDLPAGNTDEKFLIDHFTPAFYQTPEAQDRKSTIDWLLQYQKVRAQEISEEKRLDLMAGANPYVIPRNYLLHQAIEGLENGDQQLFRDIEEAIQDPYKKPKPHLMQRRPQWASNTAGCSMLSCSS